MRLFDLQFDDGHSARGEKDERVITIVNDGVEELYHLLGTGITLSQGTNGETLLQARDREKRIKAEVMKKEWGMRKTISRLRHQVKE